MTQRLLKISVRCHRLNQGYIAYAELYRLPKTVWPKASGRLHSTVRLEIPISTTTSSIRSLMNTTVNCEDGPDMLVSVYTLPCNTIAYYRHDFSRYEYYARLRISRRWDFFSFDSEPRRARKCSHQLGREVAVFCFRHLGNVELWSKLWMY